jgi:hypothetical protein
VSAVADAQGGLNLPLLNRNVKGEPLVDVSARGFGTLSASCSEGSVSPQPLRRWERM